MRPLAIIGLLAALAVLPFFSGEFYINLASQMLIAGIFALSLNLLVGYAGLTSLGHASYLGFAAYAAACHNFGWWRSMIAAQSVPAGSVPNALPHSPAKREPQNASARIALASEAPGAHVSSTTRDSAKGGKAWKPTAVPCRSSSARLPSTQRMHTSVVGSSGSGIGSRGPGGLLDP